MSDAEGGARRVTGERTPVNRELFLARLAALGCSRVEDREQVLDMPRQSVDRYLNSEVEPLLRTARRIANQLGTTVDDLWPHDRSDQQVAA